MCWFVLSALMVTLLSCKTTVKESVNPVAPVSASSDLNKPETMLRIARAAHKGEDHQTAERFYRRILVQNPKHVEALLELAELLLHQASFYDAHTLLEQVSPSDHPERLRLMGKLALGTDQPEQALECFTKLLKRYPQNTYALEGAAISHDSLGQHTEAHILYKKMMELPHTSRTLLGNYGLSLALGGHVDQGIDVLKHVCQGEHPTARERQNLGIAYALKGDLEHASQWMSVDLDSDRVRQNLAYLQNTLGHGQKINLNAIQTPPTAP